MKKFHALLLLSTLSFFTVNGQFVYDVELCQNFQGTYNDLGSTGSIINTTNFDNANSTAQPIGFNFNYNGTNYTHFILNTNGFIKLGTSASMTSPSSASLAYTYYNQNNFGGVFNSTNANDVNIISVFNHDLDSSSVAQSEYRFSTTGSSPNRVCTIQYKNVTDKNITDSSGSPLPHVQFRTMNFQIKLYETSRAIEFVYGPFDPTTDSSVFKVACVGIRGGLSQFLSALKSSSQGFDVTTFQLQNPTSLGNGFGIGFGNNNLTKSIPENAIRPLPKVGRTIRFLPKVSNDAAIKNIYTYHAQTIPWGKPHTISARMMNVGTSSMSGIWVYLDVSGANSYRDSSYYNSLGVGVSSTVSFTGYNPDNLGTDQVHIYTSSDNQVENNSLTWDQHVSNHEIGYGDSSSTWYNFGFTSGSGIFCNKYHVTGKRRVSIVRAQIGFSSTNVGNLVYGAVLSSTGDIIGISDMYTITPADLGNYVDFVINRATNGGPIVPPPLIANADFYAGLAAAGSGYYPMSLQMEATNRQGAYFTHSSVNSTSFTDLNASTSSIVQRVRQAVNARLDGTSLKIDSVTGLNNPSCALSNQSVYITLTNKDSIETNFLTDTLHLEVTSTGPINQKHTLLINQGILKPDSSITFNITNTFDLSLSGQYNISVEARQWMEVDTANNYMNFTINVVDTPEVTLKVSPDSILCYGVPTTFTATPYTAGSVAYQWKVNTVNSGGQTTTNTFSPSLVWGDKVSVDLITDHCTTSPFSVSSTPITMEINPKPKFINGITGVDTVVENIKKTYGMPLNGSSYKWKVVGGTLSDTVGSPIFVTWGSPNTGASLTVTEKDSNNCIIDHVLPVVVISVVGIDQVNQIVLGEAYPNPADNSVRIPVHSSDNSLEIALDLYDITGKQVKQIYNGEVSGNRTFVMSTADLKDGMYFYRIQTSDGNEIVKKLTIRH